MSYYMDERARKRIIENNGALGFKRVRSTMAFVKTYNTGKILRSYDTDIAAWIHTDDSSRRDTISVNYSKFNCSTTTIQHFSEFLRSNGLPSYLTIKSLAADAVYEGMLTGEVFELDSFDIWFF